jgi:hypothetical protein
MKTLTQLKSKDFSDLTMTNITRLMKKMLVGDNDELKSVLPQMLSFYQSKMEGKSNKEIANDVIRRIKGKEDKTKLRVLLGQGTLDKFLGGDKGRPPLPKDDVQSKAKKKRFDTGKTLNETLDELNEEKENEVVDETAMSKKRSVEPSGSTPEYAKGLIPSMKKLKSKMKMKKKSDMKQDPDMDIKPINPIIGGDKGRPPMPEPSDNPIIGGQHGKPPMPTVPHKLGGDKGLPPKKASSKIRAMAVKGSRGDPYAAGQYDEVKYDQLLPDGDDKKNVWEGGGGMGGGKEVWVGDETETKEKGYTPYGGQSFQLTKEEIESGEPVNFQEFFMRRSKEMKNKKKGKEVKPTQDDYEQYAKYLKGAGDSISGLKEEWERIQEDQRKNRQLILDGQKEIGQELDDSNDPFHLLRGLGYKYTGDFGDESVGTILKGGFRSVGHIAKNLFGDLGEPVKYGMDILGEIGETVGNWADYLQKKRDYEWQRTTLDEIRGYGQEEENRKKIREEVGEGVGIVGESIGQRRDKYYQPNWDINTFLPTKYDPYGVPELNGGLQRQYLQPLKRYTAILQTKDPDFADTITPQQRQFLNKLKQTLIQIETGGLNITHQQYKDLIRGTMTEFTPTQRRLYLKDTERDVVGDVKNIYEGGRGLGKGTVQGGQIPFGKQFIDTITRTSTGGGGDPRPKPSETEEDDPDPDPTKKKTKEKDPEYDSDPEPVSEDEGDTDTEEDDDTETDDDTDDDDEPELPEAPKDTAQFTTFDAGEPKFRPRMKWGGNDEMFEITESDKQKRNLIIETATMNDGINRTSELYKKQQEQYNNRYRRTFPMPRPYDYQPPSNISKDWQNRSRPVMIEGYAPVGRSFYETSYDPYTYGQYQMFTPKYDYTVFKREQMYNTAVYPDVANQVTDGGYDLKPQGVKVDAMTMIMNQRWVS